LKRTFAVPLELIRWPSHGEQQRIVFNAELFEKCGKAFVIARTRGYWIARVADWVRFT
jgi:hypothetical protein